MNYNYPYMPQTTQNYSGMIPQQQPAPQIPDYSTLERRIERLESVIFDAYAKSRSGAANDQQP